MSTGIYNVGGVTLADKQTVGLQMDSTGRLLTSASGGSGASSNQVQGTAASGATAVGNPVRIGGVDGSGNMLSPQVTTGSLNGTGIGGSINAMNVNAAVVAYDVGAAQWTLLRADSVGLFTVAKPSTLGGASMARIVASAGANIKASAGQLYGGVVTNSNAAIRYLHLYNKASAATLSTDTPVATFALPPNASVQITTDGLGAAFATGISWTFTTDNIAIPTTAGATTDVHGTLFFK